MSNKSCDGDRAAAAERAGIDKRVDEQTVRQANSRCQRVQRAKERVVKESSK